MANSKQAVTSLLTEHFRYTPLTLLDDIINTVNELIYRAVTAVEEGLSSAPASTLGFADKAASEGYNPEGDETLYPESRLEIENGVHQLETLLQTTVDKNFDKLEIYALRNILSVPEELAPWMRLGHYDNLTFPTTSNPTSPHTQPDAPTLTTLHTLRRKLTETRKLHAALLAERVRNEAYISHLRALLEGSPLSPSASTSEAPPTSSLSFISDPPTAVALGVTLAPSPAGASQSARPLEGRAKALAAQLPALRRLLAELRPYAASGGKGDAWAAVQSNPVARERRDYIETQVRRRLEREGVEVGEGVVGGRGAVGDVGGIESIAGLFSGGGTGGYSGRREGARGGGTMEE